MTTVVSILMSDIVPLRDRGVMQGVINVIFAAGAGVGAPLGETMPCMIAELKSTMLICFFQVGSWLIILAGGGKYTTSLVHASLFNAILRAFMGQAPICALAFLTVYFALHLPVEEDSDWKSNLRRIDFLGAIVLVGAVFGLLLGLDRGSNVSWTMPLTILSLCISAVLFVSFVYVEIYLAAEPFAPGHIIFDRTLFACYCCNYFSLGGWMALLFYMPLFFQAVDDVTATGAGLRLLPCILAGVSGSLFGGIMMKKTGTYYWLTIISYCGVTIGGCTVFLFSGAVAEVTGLMMAGTVVAGFGNGIGVTTTLIGLSRCSH